MKLVIPLLGLAAASLAAAPTLPVPSQLPYQWNNVVIGGGGFSPAIVFSVAERNLAYLRTDVGGAYRWDALTQRWIALQDGQAQNSCMGVESIAPDPVDPDIIYLAAGMYFGQPAAIMRSADRGASWQITPVPFSMGGNEDGRGLGERLAIDPDRRTHLFFGSRHDGLWDSEDSGRTWHKVESFPWKGLGRPAANHTHGGVSFVVFGPPGETALGRSRAMYAGVADATVRHLYRSTDAGRSWSAVTGGPASTMLPVKAAVDQQGMLYIDYCSDIGPNGIALGEVWKLDPRSGGWTNITPARGDEAEGGYMGLSLDRLHPGRLAVSTVDRWNHRDTVWLSSDSGAHWSSLRERSSRDLSLAPWLRLDKGGFGGWIAGLAFDPFDGATLAYATGLTVFRTKQADKADMVWRPWVAGIEEAVPLSLVSPPEGAHLISGIGDTHGFVHDRLDHAPERAFANPDLPQTNNVDYAGVAPKIIVRSASGYSPDPEGASLGWSEDGGRSWHKMLASPIAIGSAAPRRIDADGQAPITVSADGSTFLVSGLVTLATADRGRIWWRPKGLPERTYAVADKVDPLAWYAIDYTDARIFVSRDGAKTFTQAPAQGLPAGIASSRPAAREFQPMAAATPGTAGELWLILGGRFFHTSDGARTFVASTPVDPVLRDMYFVSFGLGKAAPGGHVPTLYAFGVTKTFGGLWRSTDAGARWFRINDDAHQWGLRYRVITGDPRLFGRVYLATDGRGIFYGDPLPQPVRAGAH